MASKKPILSRRNTRSEGNEQTELETLGRRAEDPAASDATRNATVRTNMVPGELSSRTGDSSGTVHDGAGPNPPGTVNGAGTLRRPKSLIGRARWEEHKKWTFKRNGYLCTLAGFNLILASIFLATSDAAFWLCYDTAGLAFRILFTIVALTPLFLIIIAFIHSYFRHN
ncbi:hypothetical protein DEU56DRAFT_920944 [Suillus clintonianus]|uniref:uncharacterized protein n=1 Tax=Suillus clintonianus TaxID=1904413 RepID=UPI001B87FDBE|nr:uncharacterized protein DEU56DRAFT_920944 [Suillus clintonianus]KAG2157115.1 hypothetical protein DEU56DRAFT_920944 [Suillus clintonianus]